MKQSVGMPRHAVGEDGVAGHRGALESREVAAARVLDVAARVALESTSGSVLARVAKRVCAWHALASVRSSERTEVSHGTSPEGAAPAPGRDRADRPRPDHPRGQRARRPRCAGQGRAGGGRGRSFTAAAQAAGRVGRATRWPNWSPASIRKGRRRWSRARAVAAAVYDAPPATASCRVTGIRRPGAGRHRHLVADHGAAGAPRGAGRAAPGEHQDHSVYPLGCWVYLAAESHVVPDGTGRTSSGRRDRSRSPTPTPPQRADRAGVRARGAGRGGGLVPG